MINFFKEKIASYIIEKQLKKIDHSQISFRNIFSSSSDFFIVMPADDREFQSAFEVLDFFESHRKNFTIFLQDFRVSLMPLKYRQNAFVHGITDTSRLNLPAASIQHKLNKLRFDAAVDLNQKDNLFCSFITNLVQAKVRIGFKKNGSDRFYNIQVANNEDIADKSYKNFLNCLNMF